MILTHLVMFNFFDGAGDAGAVATPSDEPIKKLVIGMGLVGKPRVHQHPIFSRQKQ